MEINSKEAKDFINKIFSKGVFFGVFYFNKLFPKRVRIQIFANTLNVNYFILLDSSVVLLKNISIDNITNEKKISLISLEKVKNIKLFTFLGIKGFCFIVDERQFKFLSHRNAENWIFHLKNPGKEVSFVL